LATDQATRPTIRQDQVLGWPHPLSRENKPVDVAEQNSPNYRAAHLGLLAPTTPHLAAATALTDSAPSNNTYPLVTRHWLLVAQLSPTTAPFPYHQ